MTTVSVGATKSTSPSQDDYDQLYYIVDAELHLSNHSDLAYSASDYSDAYCHAKRSKILSGVARVMPEILSFSQRRLEAVQDVIYYGSEAGPVSIK